MPCVHVGPPRHAMTCRNYSNWPSPQKMNRLRLSSLRLSVRLLQRVEHRSRQETRLTAAIALSSSVKMTPALNGTFEEGCAVVARFRSV